MDFKTFFFSLTPDERLKFAKKANTSVGHLNNVAYGNSKANAILCVSIEQISKSVVTRQELKPTTFSAIWPELAPIRKKRTVA
jgi:hypothetical protein